VRVGDRAPDFTLADNSGQPVTLSSFRNRSNVILFFYPKDHSLVCSLEAGAFRDSYESFRQVGAEVIGISSDTVDSHCGFSGRLQLPYTLLSDPQGAVRALYGVPNTLGVIPGRVTYLIDKQGFVRHIVSSQFQPAKHVSDTLKALRAIQSEAAPSGE
jgi:peroxiredoxin Q/BCP